MVAEGTAAAAILRTDEALCLARLGNSSEAIAVLATMPQPAASEAYPNDDRALIAGSLAATWETLGDHERQSSYRLQAGRAKAEHQAGLESVLELLQPYLQGPAAVTKPDMV